MFQPAPILSHFDIFEKTALLNKKKSYLIFILQKKW